MQEVLAIALGSRDGGAGDPADSPAVRDDEVVEILKQQLVHEREARKAAGIKANSFRARMEYDAGGKISNPVAGIDQPPGQVDLLVTVDEVSPVAAHLEVRRPPDDARSTEEGGDVTWPVADEGATTFRVRAIAMA